MHSWESRRQRRPSVSVVLAMINTVFAQENLDAAIVQWRVVADQLRDKFPRLAAMLDKSEADALPFMSFPKAHHKQIHSTDEIDNPRAIVNLKRLHRTSSSSVPELASGRRSACRLARRFRRLYARDRAEPSRCKPQQYLSALA